jgi:3-hydroxymyristoyl/3-hydroxydecanoyl-(acyl carrier protein) dehydratase
MQIDFSLNHNAPCVQGHFPGSPLVPGAYLLAKIDLCLRELLPNQRILGFTKVKFIAPLLPDQLAQLHIDDKLFSVGDAVTERTQIRITCGDQLLLQANALLG